MVWTVGGQGLMGYLTRDGYDGEGGHNQWPEKQVVFG